MTPALDVPLLTMIAAPAIEDLVLDRTIEAGHEHIRASHGAVFQRLIGRAPTITELADELGITQQGASKAVAELERLGYVARITADDKRVRRVALTDAALDVVRRSQAERERIDAQIRAAVSPDDYAAAQRVLTAALVALEILPAD